MKIYSESGRKSLYAFNEDIDRIMAEAVGEEYLEYRKLWKLTSSGEVELDFPLQLDVELSTSCNLNCPMCPSGSGTPFAKMDFRVFSRFFDEAVDKGLRAVSFNYVNEPLLRKDLARFVEYARGRGLADVMFNTNGLLLTAERARELVEAGLTKLSVSVDAVTQETYRKIRIGADFGRLMKNVDAFLEAREKLGSRLPLLKVTFLMTTANVHELDRFLEFWKVRADLVSLQSMSNPFDGKKRSDVEKRLMIGKDDPDRRESFRCPSPFQRMAIRCDGAVLACCHFRGVDLVIGNVNEHSLYEIYHSPRAAQLRKLLMAGEYSKIPVCRECAKTTFRSRSAAPQEGD